MVFAFPITAMSAIGAPCAPQPSACVPQPQPPPPIAPLLKTKIKPQFDRAVTERSNPFFRFFTVPINSQFQPCFLVFWCPVGRGSWDAINLPNCQITHLPNSVGIP